VIYSPDLSGISAEEEIASRYGVVCDIHPDDLLFRYWANLPEHPTRIDAVRFYLSTGYSSAELLQQILSGEGIVANFTMLEFASGYGCVTRHLKKLLPECSILASDIHPQAIRFIRTKIGVAAVESHVLPECLGIEDVFDVVFVLSLFSHLPDKTWGRWLNTLAARVKPGGILVFTTHGGASKLLDPQALDREGIWFRPQSDQPDLPWSDYGTTATSFGYVFDKVSQIPGARLVRYHEGIWWCHNHQDVYVLRIERQGLQPVAPGNDELRFPADEAQLARRLESAYEDLSRLTAKGSRLIAEVQDRDRRLLLAQQEIARLTGEVQDRDRRLLVAEQEIGRLAAEVQVRDQASLVAEQEIGRLAGEVQVRDRASLVAEQEIGHLAGEVQNRDRGLLVAGQEIGRLAGEVQDRDRRLLLAEQEIGRLAGEVQDRDRRLLVAEQEIGRLAGEVQDRDRRLLVAEQEIGRLAGAAPDRSSTVTGGGARH